MGNNPYGYERLTTAWIKFYVFICYVNQIECWRKEMSGMNGLGDGGVEWNGRVEGYWARFVLWGRKATASTYIENSASFECVHCLHRSNYIFFWCLHARAFVGRPLKC